MVPDNLRAGVTKAHRYEPDINPTYQDMASHYGVAVVPARVRRPKDKANVEVGVQVLERWLLAALRHHTFFSAERLGLLLDRELTEQHDPRLTSRLRKARVKQDACIEAIDYRHCRGLDKSLIARLSACQWLTEQLNILITGPIGVGKTWLACALAQKACREGYPALCAYRDYCKNSASAMRR